MKSQNRSLFVIFCFIVLITACSNQPTIQSVTSDKVVIKAPPEKFVDAYDMAKKECEKNTKQAQYITDDTAGLEVVAFNCVGEEVEVATEETEEAPAEAEEVTAETEEIPAESE